MVDGVEESSEIYRTGVDTYTSIIELENSAEEARTDTLRVYMEWEEDGTGTNDDADSELGNQYNYTLSIPVQVKVSQYSGEAIEEYTEAVEEPENLEPDENTEANDSNNEEII